MKACKAISLFLVLGIANPLCCCLGIDNLVEILQAAQSAEEIHSCCSVANESADASEEKGMAREECPHEAERLSKIVDGDTGLSMGKPLSLASHELAPADPLFSVAAASFRVRSAMARASSSTLCSGRERSQSHCVYLL